MTEIPPIATPLDQDVFCIGCGYNLRGLEPTGRCPECGLPVADSIRGDRLAFSDPAWLSRLRFGASLKLWNILIMILVGMAGGIAVGVMGAPFVVMVLVSGFGTALGLWATFCITSQEPRIALTEDPVTLRKVIRACAVIALVGSVAHQLAGWAITPGTTMRGANVFWQIINLVSGVAGLIVIVGELKYFRRFALRVPDLPLARSTRTLMWGLAITWGMVSIGGVLFAIIFAPKMTAAAAVTPSSTTTTTTGLGYTPTVATMPPGGTPLPGAAAIPGAALIGACVFGAVAFIFSIWYVALLFRYRNLFRSALEMAQSSRQ